MEKVTIYTDGACSGNPGPGGWGAILMYQGNKKEISGGKKNTTNNEMELTAVIEALKMLKFPCQVDLYSDSAYVVNAFLQNWIGNWVKNNWKTSSKEPVKKFSIPFLVDTNLALLALEPVVFCKEPSVKNLKKGPRERTMAVLIGDITSSASFIVGAVVI